MVQTPEPPLVLYALEVCNGPLDGKRWPLSEAITIGRDESEVAAALPLDRSVSRIHALLKLEGETFVLTDLDSRNGTLIDGAPIAAPTPLAPGQTFAVGRTKLRIVELPEA